MLFRSIYGFEQPATIYALAPHMHLRGSWMRFELLMPDGKRETLLNVPRYDFNWQTSYQLAEPRHVPKGAWMLVTGGFDNSAKKSATANCPAGKRAISWAWSVQLVTTNNPNTAPGLTSVTPLDFDTGSGKLPGGYTVTAETGGFYPDSWKLFAYITCASA